MNTGKASASQVVAAIATARAALKAAGYNGPITTVDTMSKHPLQVFRFPLRLPRAVGFVGHVAGDCSAFVIEFIDVPFILIPYQG